jgi:hypothetical protein
MKRLHTFDMGDVAGLSMLRAELDRAGIPYLTRNDGLHSVVGGIPVTECHPEVWVMEEDDFYRAERVRREFLAGHSREAGAWQCPQCRESLDAQFHHCWNCGSARPESA